MKINYTELFKNHFKENSVDVSKIDKDFFLKETAPIFNFTTIDVEKIFSDEDLKHYWIVLLAGLSGKKINETIQNVLIVAKEKIRLIYENTPSKSSFLSSMRIKNFSYSDNHFKSGAVLGNEHSISLQFEEMSLLECFFMKGGHTAEKYSEIEWYYSTRFLQYRFDELLSYLFGRIYPYHEKFLDELEVKMIEPLLFTKPYNDNIQQIDMKGIETNAVNTKLKWLGTPAQFGFIIQELIGKGYLEKPTASFAKDAALYLQLFDIETTPATLAKEISTGENQNSLSSTNRAKIKIAHKDQLK